jgi:hypothetical protein
MMGIAQDGLAVDDELVDLNFKVTRRFRRRFKAVANNWDRAGRWLLEQMLELWILIRGPEPRS